VSSLFSSTLWPFALATVVLLGVAAAEALSLLIGASASHWLDGIIHDADHPDGPAGEALGWLHIGRVPLLAILVIFLTTFAVTGFSFQLAAMSMVGHTLPTLLAVGLALVVAVVAVRVLGAALGKVIPRDETTAVPDASLVGRVGTVVIGAARAGRPAQARIHDEHGTVHYVMVEPEGPDESLEAGASVLLVRHLSGRRFHAIHNPKPELL
jgi:Inner membrane protein YqiJ, N-terminal/Inner membrane protein YqiJ, OB-fold